MDLYIRASALSDFTDCRRRFRLSYVKGYGTSARAGDKVSAAALGTAVHAGLAAHLVEEPWESALEEATATWTETAKKTQARKMMVNYLRRAESESLHAGYRTVEVETRMSAHLGDFGAPDNLVRVFITGQPDAIMEDEFGDLGMVDHKTTSDVRNITGKPHKRQAHVYDWLYTASTGKKLKWFVWNIISSRTPDGPLHYEMLTFNDDMRAVFRQQLDGIVSDIVNLVLKDTEREAYPNPSMSCKWCPFQKVCGLMDSNPAEAQQILDSNYRDTQQETILHQPQGDTQ